MARLVVVVGADTCHPPAVLYLASYETLRGPCAYGKSWKRTANVSSRYSG